MQGLLPSWWEGSFVSQPGFWEVLLNLYPKITYFRMRQTNSTEIQILSSSTRCWSEFKVWYFNPQHRRPKESIRFLQSQKPTSTTCPCWESSALAGVLQNYSSSKQNKTKQSAFHYLSLFCSPTRQVGVSKYMSALLRDKNILEQLGH